MDGGISCVGCASSPGRAHHPQDAADILQIQTPASQWSLSLRERGTSEIPQGRNMHRDCTRHYCRDTVVWFPNKSSPAPTLLTEGGVAKNGRFLSVSSFNDALLTKFFSREVFSLLLRKQLINLSLVQKMLRWQHTGFNVHSKVRTRSREEAERLGKYMIRSILSLKKLSFDETEAKVFLPVRERQSRRGADGLPGVHSESDLSHS